MLIAQWMSHLMSQQNFSIALGIAISLGTIAGGLLGSRVG